MVNPKLLLDLPAIPENLRGEHNSGKVLIGPDNNVYLVIGEVECAKPKTRNQQNGPEADGTSSILRVTQEEKSCRPLNIGTNTPLDLYYAIGIRNSFGMDFDPVTGYIWDTGNGPQQR